MSAAPQEVAYEALVFAGMCLAAAGMLLYALLKWLNGDIELQLPRWRQVVFVAGFLAVIFQAALFIMSWRQNVSDYVSFGRWARLVLPSFLLAASCSIAGRGPSRWWLLSVSVLLFVLCFLIVLSA